MSRATWMAIDIDCCPYVRVPNSGRPTKTDHAELAPSGRQVPMSDRPLLASCHPFCPRGQATAQIAVTVKAAVLIPHGHGRR